METHELDSVKRAGFGFRPLFRGALVCIALAVSACQPGGKTPPTALEDGGEDKVVDINQSSVKRQSIGNCWLYAVAGWAESLHGSLPAAALSSADSLLPDVSESYWSYWYWFDQIVGSSAEQVSTGGSFYLAKRIIQRYGMMNERDFIPEEAEAEMSYRQKAALDAINAELKSGALKEPASRTLKNVREALDRAWGLADPVRAALSATFGPDEQGKFSTFNGQGPFGQTIGLRNSVPAGVPILRQEQVKVRTGKDPASGQERVGTLKDLLSSGASSWQEIYYPDDPKGRRTFQKRVQRAMHDGHPVLISWYVDFNYLDAAGTFRKPAGAPPVPPGRQGGHMTILEDYQIRDVPGHGTLSAGVLVNDQKMLEAALDDQASIEFLRIKNSWGSYRPDRPFALPGYHDLFLDYLDGPIAKCAETPDGQTDTNNCKTDINPLESVVLPKGY